MPAQLPSLKPARFNEITVRNGRYIDYVTVPGSVGSIEYSMEAGIALKSKKYEDQCKSVGVLHSL